MAKEKIKSAVVQLVDIKKLKPHPDNPRTIHDKKFKDLCKSIKNNFDYFMTRPVLYNKDFVVFAGNQRYEAAKEMGYKEIPGVLMNISEARQKEIMIRDNRSAGEWDFDKLANVFEIEDLKDWGFSSWELGIEDEDEKADIIPDWKGMPEFNSEDQKPLRTIFVHFRSEKKIQEFAKMLNQTITNKTRFVWFPKEKRSSAIENLYTDKK